MLQQIVQDYKAVVDLKEVAARAVGSSAAPKDMIFHIRRDNAAPTRVLDIGFGVGSLGSLIRNNPDTARWEVDGIDGWEPNCNNRALVARAHYRNIWHGLAQDIPRELMQQYEIICLLDVIEHLGADDARQLLTLLLASLGRKARLFVSTPLWFYPQDQLQADDLEEHLIAVPASSMQALDPVMYSVNEPLIGGFVLDRHSLDLADLFQPTTNRQFSYEHGIRVARATRLHVEPGTHIKLR